jgi:hypothetical protein
MAGEHRVVFAADAVLGDHEPKSSGGTGGAGKGTLAAAGLHRNSGVAGDIPVRNVGGG